MPRTTDFLLDAAQEAQNSTLDIKHGAVLVRAGKIIGRGHNSNRSRLAILKCENFNQVALHSEVAALHHAHRCIL